VTPIQTFNRQLALQKLLQPQKTVVVAVSTGVDSMVLLELLQQLPLRQRPRIIVAHVNHHLRTQSRVEADYLATYCREHQLTLALADWLVADHPVSGVEAAARQFRYQFFTKVMNNYQAAAVLTAHHANDQVETYLMKLARGGDIAQLTGIAASRPFATGQLVRPLLTWSKATLREYAVQHQLTFYEDVTNQDVQLTRNRIRQRVVPELAKVNPQLLTHVAAYQQQLADLLAAKQQMVLTLLPTIQDSTAALVIANWQQVPSQWQTAVLSEWLHTRTSQLFSEVKLAPLVHWLQNLPRSTGVFQLNGTWELTKNSGIVDVTVMKKRGKKLMPCEKIMVDLDQWQKITATQVAGVFTKSSSDRAQPFWLRESDWPLMLRPWQSTDRITLKGGGHQTVRRILINQKVPVELRSQVMVLVSAQENVLWVVGYKYGYRESGTQSVFLALKQES